MKRYKLKRDLPTFKAGDKFYINECGDLVQDVPLSNNCQTEYGNIVYFAETLEHFPNIITDWFEEVPEEPKTVWDLKDGDECWVIEEWQVKECTWYEHECFQLSMRLLGNCFLTEKEAKKELARREAKVILERDTKGFKPNWEDVSNKYEVYYDYELRELDIEYYNTCCSHSNLWFESSKDAKASIKNHEKEWKIYLGGVEE